LLQQVSTTRFDIPSQANGVVNVIVYMPVVGVNPEAENTLVNPVTKVVVRKVWDVDPRLRLKSLNVVPSDVMSKDSEVIFPGVNPAAINSEAGIKYWDFSPPYK